MRLFVPMTLLLLKPIPMKRKEYILSIGRLLKKIKEITVKTTLTRKIK